MPHLVLRKPIASPVLPKLVIKTGTIPDGTVNVAYSATLVASGGATPYTWSYTGSLLTGLTFSNGVISGNTKATGTMSITVKVTDSLRSTATQAYSFAIHAAPTNTVKLRIGHYIQCRAPSQSGPGGQNWADMAQLVGSKATYQGINFVYNWADLEGAQGDYSPTTKNLVGDFIQLLNNYPGFSMAAYMRTFGNIAGGGAGPITAANYKTYDGRQGIIPNYVITCGGKLTSTDGTIYSNSIPASPNPNQYGWTCSGWATQNGATGYTYFVGGNWWHPVIAQCFLNCLQNLANTIIPAGTYGGIYYPQYTLNQHPKFEFLGSWDELSVGFGQGGSFSAAPADDNKCFYANNSPYVTPGAFDRASSNGVKCVCTQVYAAREQVLIGATKAFTATGVGTNLSFTVTCNDGANSASELRNHIHNLYLGRVEYGEADVGSTDLGVNAQGVPDGVTGARFAFNIFMGGVYANEYTRSGPGGCTFPKNGVPATINGVTGFIYAGHMPWSAYIEGVTDYGGHNNLVASWVGKDTYVGSPTYGKLGYNAAQILGINYVCILGKAIRVFWQNTDSKFGNATGPIATSPWQRYIDPGVAALPQPLKYVPTAYGGP